MIPRYFRDFTDFPYHDLGKIRTFFEPGVHIGTPMKSGFLNWNIIWIVEEYILQLRLFEMGFHLCIQNCTEWQKASVASPIIYLASGAS